MRNAFTTDSQTMTHRSSFHAPWLRCLTTLARSLALAATLLLAACVSGGAEVVRRDTTGGLLALRGDRRMAWEEAEARMARHCGPGNYQVVLEERVAVGERTQTVGGADLNANADQHRLRARESFQATTTTTDLHEYRLGYRCGRTLRAASRH